MEPEVAHQKSSLPFTSSPQVLKHMGYWFQMLNHSAILCACSMWRKEVPTIELTWNVRLPAFALATLLSPSLSTL